MTEVDECSHEFFHQMYMLFADTALVLYAIQPEINGGLTSLLQKMQGYCAECSIASAILVDLLSFEDKPFYLFMKESDMTHTSSGMCHTSGEK